MANHGDNRSAGRANVDLSESSVYGNGQTELESNDVATADRIDRLEAIIGGAEEEPLVVEGKLGRQFAVWDGSTEEGGDGVRGVLVRAGDPFAARDGWGR